MKIDKVSKLLGVILSCVSFLAFGIFFIYVTATNPERSTEGWIPTTATVVDVQVDTNLETMTTIYHVWITYKDSNDDEHFMLYGHDRNYKVDDKIPIKYDPNDPNIFADVDAKTINGPLFGYIGIGLTIVGVLIPSIYFGVNIYKKRKGINI